MMSDKQKDKLVELLEKFVEEENEGSFPVGDATVVYMADAVETIWNALSYHSI
jgi:hypothetical protein